jgi:nucleoside-diphosphate-sugar epimerase/predicted lipid carrier protein YhbT
MSARAGVLLTGATGLLGRYLLRDLLTAGRPVVVLARDRPGRSAEDRIAELVAVWSEAAGRPLPRPVVLAGELGPGGPGLTAADRHWLGRHCRAVVHAAASIAFRQAPDGEPWRTNVDGTSTLLRLCQEAGLAEWHQVSTAFVCGRRTGTICEEELDCGQDFHNPYERTKLEAEQLLREASGLRLTVYRPAILVGDSRTGHTSSYDGLYRFLGLAARLAEAASPSAGRAPGTRRPFPLRLPLGGDEPGNLVPVDWAAQAVGDLLRRPVWHGRTFHLVARAPVRARLVLEVATEELRLEGVELVGPAGVPDPSRLEEVFQEGLADYWPYLAGSPAFADTNTARALPHLPPPPVDEPLLRRLIRFAIADGWGRGARPTARAAPLPSTDSPCAEYIEQTFPRQARQSGLARAAELNARVGFDIRGPGGGQWSYRWERGELTSVRRGLDGQAEVTYHMDPATFQDVIGGRQTPQQAFFERRVRITGNLEAALKLAVLFSRFLVENPCPPSREAANGTPR